MIQRFQIEDIVVQDTSGVVFRALDTETNQHVAIRRFFPFGPNGGGLNLQEQATFNAALARLSEVTHPSLRAVIAGGCDPVDGMPYIATEWIEGSRLQTFLDHGPLTIVDATSLLNQALEVCQLVSEVMGREAVWIETGMQAIVVAAPDTGRGVTFWISPLKCLGKHDRQYGFESLVTLAQQITSHHGKSTTEHTPLGTWLSALDKNPKDISLVEARRLLTESSGPSPAMPTRKLAQQASKATTPARRKSSSDWAMTTVIFVLLLATVIGGWALVQRNAALAEQSAASTSSSFDVPLLTDAPSSDPLPELAITSEKPRKNERIVPGGMTAEQANQRAAEMNVESARTQAEKEAAAAHMAAEVAKRGGIFTIADHALLIAQSGKEVTLEGVLKGFAHSSSKATLYLVFSENPDKSEARGAIVLRTANDDLKQASLQSLLGKKIHLKGKVRVENFAKRPIIMIRTRAAIQEVE